MQTERGNAKLKWIDQNIGPLLLRLIAIARKIFVRKKPLLNDQSHVGFLKLAAIGDTVLLSALIADLRSEFSGLKITLFVGSSNQAYADLLPEVDHIVVIPIKNPFKAINLIRQNPTDILINADSWPRISALIGAFAKTKWLMGFKTAGQFRHSADDELIDHDPKLHEIENYRNFLRKLGLTTGRPPLLPRGEFQDQVKRPGIAFHLWPGGTKSFLREWKFSSWALLLEKLADETTATFYLTGSKDQFAGNQKFIESLASNLQKRVVNSAGLKLDQTVGLLKQVELLVSVDTGIMHVGAALGTPTISLHGPSNHKRWGPIGPFVYPVQSQMPGAGHLVLGFEYESDINFLDGIPVSEVFAMAQEALKIKKLRVGPIA